MTTITITTIIIMITTYDNGNAVVSMTNSVMKLLYNNNYACIDNCNYN